MRSRSLWLGVLGLLVLQLLAGCVSRPSESVNATNDTENSTNVTPTNISAPVLPTLGPTIVTTTPSPVDVQAPYP